MKHTRNPRKTHHNKSDDRMHRDIWELARESYEIHSVRIEVFVKFSDNTSMNSDREIERMCKWLLQCRSSVGKSDINAVSSCPDVCQHVDKLSMSDRDDNTVCVLGQKDMSSNVYQQWGPQTPDVHGPTTNDNMRLFGIALSDDHRDELHLLTDAMAKNRQLLDAYCSYELAMFQKLSLLKCNIDIVAPHPPSCAETIIRKESNHNKSCNPMWEELDPNDDECVNSPLTEKQIELMWRALSTLCKDVQREWSVITGDRPSDAGKYSDFESRDPENFARCNE